MGSDDSVTPFNVQQRCTSNFQTLKWFLSSAVSVCGESLAVFNRAGVALIVHKPITEVAAAN